MVGRVPGKEAMWEAEMDVGKVAGREVGMQAEWQGSRSVQQKKKDEEEI